MQGLQDHPLWIALQPIVDLHTSTVIGHEALLRSRSNSPEMPETLFNTAARDGHLAELEERARRLALDRVTELPADQKLFLNICTGCLDIPVQPQSTIDPQRIVLELSERHAVVDNARLIKQVRTWRAEGYLIALDDYGVGYMGPGAVLVLKPHIIKLDRVLIAGIDHDPRRQTMLHNIQQLTNELGIVPIAEGIETPEELAYLGDAGIRYGQGYLLGRPDKRPQTQATCPSPRTAFVGGPTDSQTTSI